jgi:hypothetical protein
VQLVVMLDDHARAHLSGGNRHKRKTPSISQKWARPARLNSRL